jgi:hypothetical protein
MRSTAVMFFPAPHAARLPGREPAGAARLLRALVRPLTAARIHIRRLAGVLSRPLLELHGAWVGASVAPTGDDGTGSSSGSCGLLKASGVSSTQGAKPDRITHTRLARERPSVGSNGSVLGCLLASPAVGSC